MQGLSRIERRSEADIEPIDGRRITAEHGANDRPAGHAIGAEAVQDRPWETGLGGKRRLGMKRIEITVQPKQQRLIGSGLAALE